MVEICRVERQFGVRKTTVGQNVAFGINKPSFRGLMVGLATRSVLEGQPL